jgi:cytochrome bd-type quinol oxidase subunit 1
MIRDYLDELLIMVGISFILAIIETILYLLKLDKEKKDLYMRWFNIFGIAIILTIVFQEVYSFFLELKRFLSRL